MIAIYTQRIVVTILNGPSAAGELCIGSNGSGDLVLQQVVAVRGDDFLDRVGAFAQTFESQNAVFIDVASGIDLSRKRILGYDSDFLILLVDIIVLIGIVTFSVLVRNGNGLGLLASFKHVICTGCRFLVHFLVDQYDLHAFTLDL